MKSSLKKSACNKANLSPTKKLLMSAFAASASLLISPFAQAQNVEDMVLVNANPPFLIDIFEVSNAKAAAALGQNAWGSDKPARLSGTEADTYCRSQGKRLPTEAEWLQAASNLGTHREYSIVGDREPTKQEINVDKVYGGSQSPYDFVSLGIDGIGTVGMSGNRNEWVTQPSGGYDFCGAKYESGSVRDAHLSRICSKSPKSNDNATARCVLDYTSGITVNLTARVSGALANHVATLPKTPAAAPVAAPTAPAVPAGTTVANAGVQSPSYSNTLEIKAQSPSSNNPDAIEPRNNYLIIYKEAASHFRGEGANVEAGVYRFDPATTQQRGDLNSLVGGGFWKNPFKANDQIVVGYAPGTVSGTANEIWAEHNGQYFLLKNQAGRLLNMVKGVPRELIPAAGGAFIISGNHNVFFAPNAAPRNVRASFGRNNERAADVQHMSVSSDGTSLIFLTRGNDVAVINRSNRITKIHNGVKVDNGMPQVAITPEGVYYKSGSKIYYKSVQADGSVGAAREVYQKRPHDNKIHFRNGQAIVESQQSQGGRALFVVTPTGLEEYTPGQRRRAAIRGGERNTMLQYGEDWLNSAKNGEFQSAVPRPDIVNKILGVLQGNEDTWANVVGPFDSGLEDVLKAMTNEIYRMKSQGQPNWKDYDVFKFPISSLIKVIAASEALKQQYQQSQQAANPPADPWEKIKSVIFKKNVIVVMPGFLDDPELGATNVGKALDTFLKEFRAEIQRGDLKIVTSAADEHWEKATSGDSSAEYLATVVPLQEPDLDTLLQILSAKIVELQRTYSLSFEEGTAEIIIESLEDLEPLEKEPGRSLNALEEIARSFAAADQSSRFVSAREVRNHLYSDTFDASSLENIDLAEVEAHFNSEIIGQQAAKEKILQVLSSLSLGVVDLERPLATLLFTGPTGVGKTLTAEVLADALRVPIVKMDMSLFNDFDPQSRNTKRIVSMEGKPFVLLLDEIDKHPEGKEFLNTMGSLIETGVYAAGSDSELNLRNAIIVMTGNFAQKLILERSDLPQDELIYEVGQFVQDDESPEEEQIPRHFWSRIQSSTVAFPGLTDIELEQIADKFVQDLAKDILDTFSVEVIVDAKVLTKIVQNSFNTESGARPIRNAITEQMKSRISLHMSRKDAATRRQVRQIYITTNSSGRQIIRDNTEPGFDRIMQGAGR